MTSYILLAVGLLMIYLEFFLPGGVLGILGGIFVLTSMVWYGMNSDSAWATLFFVVMSLWLVTLLIRVTLLRIPKAKPGRSIYSDDAQSGYYASKFDKKAEGKIGVVTSDLKPGGHVIIDGEHHLAISQSGYLKKGEKVQVIGGEGESLIVKKYKGEA